MKPAELKASLNNLGISQTEFARLLDITPRAVSLWMTEERILAGPAVSYLRLLESLPRTTQLKEIARIKQEEPAMYDGMFSFQFQGAQGMGLGALVLNNGRLFGSDGGVQYDGSYQPAPNQPGFVNTKVHLTVPPNVALVQGIPPQPMSYGFDLECTFATRGSTFVNVQTPFGDVQGKITFLREVPN